jgi:esterase/lipase superfamily enzyme
VANVEIYFITNRNYLPENKRAVFGPHFNPDGVAALRFGKAVYNVEGRNASFEDIHVYPDAKVMAGETTVPPAGSGSFLDDLRGEMRQGRDTLIFIHGYNVSFTEALKAGALLAAGLPQDINLVVFSWPSDGTAVPYMSYYSDREDARASGPALARAYLKLFDFVKTLRETEVRNRTAAGADPVEAAAETELCERCIHVLAHSMGNYVLRHGVQAIKAKDPRKIVRMFDQVILAAADEDDDTFEFESKLRDLPILSRRVTVYHNHRDRALLISDRTKSNPDRLGSEGPRMLDMLPKKVVIVDCSRVAAIADPRVLHSYYIRSPAVTADINAVLDDSPDDLIGNREVVRAARAYRLAS